VEPIDVILIDMPCLLRDILRDAVHGAGMTIRAEHATVSDALDALTATGEPGTEVLAVLGSAEHMNARGADALRRRLPDARLLAVTADGRRAILYEPGRASVTLTDASPARVVAMLHGAS